MALLVNPTNPNAEAVASDLQAAARTLGLQMHLLHASSERDLERPPSPPWSNCEPAGS
jgi:putative ABC transport system substrate-binding protein